MEKKFDDYLTEKVKSLALKYNHAFDIFEKANISHECVNIIDAICYGVPEKQEKYYSMFYKLTHNQLEKEK